MTHGGKEQEKNEMEFFLFPRKMDGEISRSLEMLKVILFIWLIESILFK